MDLNQQYCAQYGHAMPIQFTCIKKDCQFPNSCCEKCIEEVHKNHSNQDFIQIESANCSSQINQRLTEQIKQQVEFKQPAIDDLHYKIKSKQSYDDLIICTALSNNNQFLAIATEEGLVILKSLFGRVSYKEFKARNFVYYLQFSPNNKFLYINLGERILMFNLRETFKPIRKLQVNNRIQSLSLTNDGRKLISGSEQTLEFWSIDEGQVFYNYPLPDQIWGISISKNQKYLACPCSNRFVYLLDCSDFLNLKLLAEWKVHSQCMEFTPDSRFILISQINQLMVWSVENLINQEFTPFKVFQNCQSFQLSNDGSILIGYLLQTIYVINYETQNLIQKIDTEQPIQYFDQVFPSILITSDMKQIIANLDDSIYIFE